MHRDLDFAALPASSAPARIVEIGRAGCVAFPAHVTLELVEHPAPILVPFMVPHGCGLLAWQNQRLPMIDLEALFTQSRARTEPWRYALVLAWQGARGEALRHGAIALDALPEMATVSDAQACAQPAGASAGRFALAWFDRGGRSVPILETQRLFARGAW
jgi:chemotaxis signal transduction protein